MKALASLVTACDRKLFNCSRCCQIHCTFNFLFPCIDSKLFLFGMCETGVIASLEAGCSP